MCLSLIFTPCRAVHVLHFIDDVARQLFDTQQTQDVLRIGRAVHNRFALVHHLAFVHQDVLFLGHEFFPDLAFGIGDLQADLALGLLAERHSTGHLGQRALVLGRTRFEQLGHARQTAGNVAGLLTFDRDTGQHFAGAHVLAVAHLDQSTDWKPMVTEWSVPGIFTSWPLASISLTCGARPWQRTTALGVDHHQRGQAGHLVDLLGHREAFFDVLELHLYRRTR
jgi:hypothetical protein